MGDYRDSHLDIEERVRDLLDRMTLEEMILQTDQYFSCDFTTPTGEGNAVRLDMEKADRLFRGFSVGSIQAREMTPEQINELQSYAVEKTRLGIPFLFSEEALHGLCHSDATVFPQQIGLAATFDPVAGFRMGRAIGTEARALGIHETYSPVMDLIRDPRYGRTEESYGEDTHLCSEFARAVVEGMQGRDLSDPDAVAAEPKHYAGYGAPVGGLNCAPCALGRHEVFSDCLPVFEAAIAEAGAADVMCSYNAIDGIPVAADHELLTEVLRDRWGMRGFVRSDLTAVKRLYDNHYLAPTHAEAIAMGLEAGVDLQLYDFPHDEWQSTIRELVESGRIGEDVVRQACGRVLRMKFLLGLFDNPYIDPTLHESAVRNEEHLDLSLEIARESMVLLKNENGILPLSKDIGTVAVLGPSAGRAVLGDYSVDGRGGTSTLEAVKRIVSPRTKVLYDPGCKVIGDAAFPFPSGVLTDEEGRPGLTARYYNSPEPEGDPVLTVTDRSVDFNWHMNGVPEGVDAGCFSVAWTGTLTPAEAFDGMIGFRAQDSMRLFVDGKKILDMKGLSDCDPRMVPFRFEKGVSHGIRVELRSDGHGARVVFGWDRAPEDFGPAVELARQADVAVICVGDDRDSCGENLDRVSLDLPGNQLAFVKAVAETGTPVVLVMQTGRPVTAVWENDHVPAILEAWFPGERGGEAIAETLFGDSNPSGRLPISFPRHVGQIPCHYSRRPGGGKRYVETDWLPLWPFGYGLSYTTFAYGDLTLSPETVKPGESVTATFSVRNTGSRRGAAVPQLYLRDRYSSVVKPQMTLAAFRRVELEPGEEKTVSLEITAREMRTLRRDFVWEVEPGDFRVFLADNAEKIVMSRDFRVE